ncbi:MAG: hypothetical protein GEV11_06930 [Streptosporangiales bacterium]|nr:hypothetical protein [Streptosporangiales bacterium]
MTTIGRTGRPYRAPVALAGAALAVLALGGCATAKEELVEAADEKCRTISERFGGDLGFGESIGGEDDLKKFGERRKLIKDLRDTVRSMPKPETGQAELNAWLGKLDEFDKAMLKTSNMSRYAQPGMDLLIAMQVGVLDETTQAVGPAAKRFGLRDCAQIESWRTFPKKK